MADESTPPTLGPLTPGPPSDHPISDLPQLHRFVTGHNADGKAVVHSQSALTWSPYDHGNMGFAVPFTTSQFPANLNDNADVAAHERVVGSGRLSLVNPGGTVLRVVEFSPGYRCHMHRTRSLDYGIVLEGEVDMELDGGERVSLSRGDVAVQRGTMHAWINRSPTRWARMVFVLQDCEPVVVGGQELAEDLGSKGAFPLGGKGE